MPPSIRSAKIDEKDLALRKQLWPDLDESQFWHRKESKGFTTIPRALPLFMVIFNEATDKRVSETYFGLWARANDRAVVQLHSKGDEMATAAGFTGSRMVSTWEVRLDLLEKIGAIKMAASGGKKRAYAVILNPYHVVALLREQGQVTEANWNALAQLSLATGAEDLIEPKPVETRLARKRPRSK